MKELVIISGKGGTGKTSIAASFVFLAGSAVIADCDVDAADLHIVLSPEIRRREFFAGGSIAVIDQGKCNSCGACREMCRFDAISDCIEIDPFACEGCSVCHYMCPCGAVEMARKTAGEWFISETRHGPMIHAKLATAEENSGKLVSLVRAQARKTAGEECRDLVIIDGSPGVGCPVIASITGTVLALVVTEPTMSGIHDMKRTLELAAHFGIPSAICINKADLNPEMTAEIENYSRKHRIPVVARIPFEPAVTRAQIAGASIVEFADVPASREINAAWKGVLMLMNERG